MPYSRTQSRIDALYRIKLLKIPFNYVKLRSKKLPTSVRDAVYQNCVFQLSAILEDYLLQLVSGWCSRLIVLKADNSRLPLSTRFFVILKCQEDAFRGYIGSNDETKFTETLMKNPSLFEIANEKSNIPNIDIGYLLTKGKKFPSVSNIDALFRRLGVKKISKAISARVKSNFDLDLTSFMDVRNSLAHESPPSITELDVERYFHQTTNWIAAIDREIYLHVLNVSGSDYW